MSASDGPALSSSPECVASRSIHGLCLCASAASWNLRFFFRGGCTGLSSAATGEGERGRSRCRRRWESGGGARGEDPMSMTSEATRLRAFRPGARTANVGSGGQSSLADGDAWAILAGSAGGPMSVLNDRFGEDIRTVLPLHRGGESKIGGSSRNTGSSFSSSDGRRGGDVTGTGDDARNRGS